jgi:ubiquinone/menaquinone biosynthesis C-methylase UbiE
MATVSIQASKPERIDQAAVGQVLQIGGGMLYTAALYTATELAVPDLLSNGPRTTAELATATGSNEDALYRVLRALAALGIFEEVKPRTFANTPPTEYLRSDVPGSVRDSVIWMSNPFHFNVWKELSYSVKTGKPAVDHLYGKSCFEVFDMLPDVAADFNAAMTCISSQIVPAVLDAYDFSGVRTLMDVAGGHGFVICEILRSYPEMKGIIFDIAPVIEGAKCRVCDLNLEHRCNPVAGDFFEEIPAGADAYYFQHIIHDWDNEKALTILKNTHRALKGVPDGRIIVVDSVLPENSDPHFGKLLDLEMLLMPGGRERTEKEFRALFSQAGFEITKILPTKVAENVIEARVV